MAAAVAVVQLHEGVGGGLHGLHVGRADARPDRPGDLGVRAGDQPVAAGLHERGGRDGRAAEEVAPPDVAAPQLADLLDGADDGRRELEADAGGEVLAVGHADLVDRDRAAQLPAQRLGDDGGRPAPGLLAAEPAGHGGLVVPQVETVLGAAHVHAARQARVGAAGFLDERLQPFVRLSRHEWPCGHGVYPL